MSTLPDNDIDFSPADDQDVWTIDRTAEEVFLCLAGIREEEVVAENRQQYGFLLQSLRLYL
jgi:hypothetical protein